MPLLTTVVTRSAARPEPAAPGWRAAILRGLDALVAFATLRDAAVVEDDLEGRTAVETGAPRRRAWEHGPSAVAAAAAHPHRRPPRARSRARRPGAVRPTPQACVTPLAPARVPRRRERMSGVPR